MMQLDREVEEENLFIPDQTAESPPIIVVVDASKHEQSIYSGMTAEHATKAREIPRYFWPHSGSREALANCRGDNERNDDGAGRCTIEAYERRRRS